MRVRVMLTQEELAGRAGITVRTVRNIELDLVRPRMATLRQLVAGLGLEPDARRGLDRALIARLSAGEHDGADGEVLRPADVAATWLRQLPPALPDFVGRGDAIAEAVAVLRGSAGEGRLVIVTGPPGIGKTALAVRLGWLVAHDFPGGQLFLDMRGFGAQPLDPADALAALLRAFGVSDDRLPRELPARAAMYRSLLAGRPALVVLDNAADMSQIDQLLPGDPACAVIVTTRRAPFEVLPGCRLRLPALTATEGADLVKSIIGKRRAAAQPAAVARLVDLCERLPLAVRIAAGKLASRPYWTPAQLAERLDDERRRLDELANGDVAVRAMLSVSYQELDPAAKRLLRLLAVVAAPESTSWIAAALLATSERLAEDTLERLADNSLVTVSRDDPGGDLRYHLHDLLRLYARERSHAEDTRRDRMEAIRRFADECVARAGAAAAGLRTGGFHYRLFGDTVSTDTRPATAWFAAECGTAMAVLCQAHDIELWEQVVALALALAPYVELRGRWDEWELASTRALDAARRCSDVAGEVDVLRGLAELETQRGSFDLAEGYAQSALDRLRLRPDPFQEAAVLHVLAFRHLHRGLIEASSTAFERSLALFRQIGDERGEHLTRRRLAQALRGAGRDEEAAADLEGCLPVLLRYREHRAATYTMQTLGTVRQNQGRLAEARRLLEESATGFRAIGDRRGEVAATHGLGETLREQGDLDAAAGALTNCLVIAADLHDPLWRAAASHSLADVRRDQGEYAEAISLLTESLVTVRTHRDQPGEAAILHSLGACLSATGERERATRALNESADLFHKLGFQRDEDRVRSTMRGLDPR